MSIHIVRCLCVVDLCQGLCQCLPKIGAMIAGNRWILGEELAVFVFSTKGTFLECNLMLVCLLAVNKIVRCLNPLGTLHVSVRQRRLVTFFVVVVFLVNWLWYFYQTITGYYVMFYSELICDMYCTTSDNNKYSTVEILLVGLFLLLPTIVLCIASAMLVYVAFSMAHSAVKKKNITVTILVALFFLVQVIPFCVWFAIYETQTGYDGMLKTSFSIYASRIIFQLETINIFINPAVYFITMKRFRSFCKRYLRRSGGIKILSDTHSLGQEPATEPVRTTEFSRLPIRIIE